MKSVFKLLGITVLVAVIGFTMIACDQSDSLTGLDDGSVNDNVFYTNLVTVGNNGNWLVDGVDTGREALCPHCNTVDPDTLTIAIIGDTGRKAQWPHGAPFIGHNGNWQVNGVDINRPAYWPGVNADEIGTPIIGKNGNWWIVIVIIDDGEHGNGKEHGDKPGNDPSFPIEEPEYGTYGHFSYTVFNGEITITGYDGTDEVINIPSQIEGKPVTTIGDEAFAGDLDFIDLPDEDKEKPGEDNGNHDREHKEEPDEILPLPRGRITAVNIPDTVTTIGNQAFVWNQINEINIPDSVTSIGTSAFAHNNLTQVIIPDNGVGISALAFAFNELTEVNIPDSVLFIESNVFFNNKITEATIGNGVSYINMAAFASNQLSKITIPNGVYVIGRAAFAGNQLTEIIIGKSVDMIGDYAFVGNKLTQITFPDSVNFIGQGAFNGNQLTEITIGANVSIASTAAGFSADAIGGGFENAYKNGGRRAGTYTRPTGSTIWTRQ